MLNVKQDKVNTADSAWMHKFIFLIIFVISQNRWTCWSGWKRWSCLVFARKIVRMILIQNIELMGPLMIYMALIYVRNGRCHTCDTQTDGQWKVEQYSVWAESAIISSRFSCKEIRQSNILVLTLGRCQGTQWYSASDILMAHSSLQLE